MHSWLVLVEARNLTRSTVHRCIRGEEGRSRTARHELLKMVPNTDSAAALVRACFELPCILRGSSSFRRNVGTCAAGANTTGLLPDVVVSAGEVLRSGTTVGEVILPSWPRDRAADAANVSTDVAADIAAAAALDASNEDDPVAGYDLDHRCGAWLNVCRGGLAHGLHLQPRFGRRTRGQRLARGLRNFSSFGLTRSSPPEQSLPPGLTDRKHFSLRTNKPHRKIGELGRPVLYV